MFLVHGDDGSLQLWEAFEGVPLAEPALEREGQVDFSTDGRWLLVQRQGAGEGATRLGSGSIRVIGRDLSAARHRVLPYEGPVSVLHFSADGRYGLVGKHGLVVFNPATGEAIRRIDRKETGYSRENGGATWLTTDAWFSPSDDKIVAICESDGGYVVKVFETATGKTLHTSPAQKMAQTFRVRFAGEST